MSTCITASKARALTGKHRSSDKSILEHIQKLCDQRIQDAAKLKRDRIVYMVPVFIFGFPLYYPDSIYLQLYQSLTKRGFEVYSTDKPLELFITWREHKAPPQKPCEFSENKKPKSFQKLSILRKQIKNQKT